MKISYNWLQDLIKQKLPQPENLADLLTKYAFETEMVGKVSDDHLLDIDVLPNRAHDCLSHLGIARQITAIKNYKLKTTPRKIKNSNKIQNFLKVKVEDNKLCPRYTARALVNIKVGPSPQWMQKRLRICGLRPISNIVDITNYVMLETGQPLHAFDADKLKDQTIIVRRAKKGEKIVSLDNEKYDLDGNILVIADAQKPVCIAGIKGGLGPEIDKQTKRVILEAANFSPQIIRHGSKQLKLETDASWRFSHGLDSNLTESAIDQAAYLIQKIARGQVLANKIDFYPKKIKPWRVKLDISRVRSLLGTDIPLKEIKSILGRLGFLVSGSIVTVPTRRLDVTIPEDLIEEIAQVYGYEKIPSQLPAATLVPAQRNEDLIYQNKIRDILVNLGFSEVYNYSFIGHKETAVIEVKNPVSQEQKYLRPNLIINLLKNLKENKKYFKEVRLFEIGKVFSQDEKEKEKKKLAGATTDDFYRIKGIVDSLLNKLRISDVWYDEGSGKKIRAEVKVGNDLLGWIGDNVFELDFEKLVQLASEERIYAPPSKYPAVIRDIALLVEPGTKVIEVMNLIHAAGGPLIRDIDLFDIYEGEEIPDGKKNLAFHIIFQSDDHTLTDREINQLQEKIIKALEEEGGWQVRKNA